MKLWSVIFMFNNYIFLIYGARILGVLHIPTLSHTKIGITLLNSLAERGHNVTILSALDPLSNCSNVRYIYLDGMFDTLTRHRFSFHSSWSGNTFTFYHLLSIFSNELTASTLKSNAMKNLMKNEKEKFDIVFIEPLLNPALFGLGHHFDAQVIVLSTSNSFFVNKLSSNIAPYSFVPSAMSSLTHKMNFYERFTNTIGNLIFNFATKLYNEPFQKKLYNKYFPNTYGYDEAVKNASLHFVNTHVVYESPRPYLPNMIPIGGLHIKKPKQLPKDIQEYLNSAKDGAIFFSLGSYMHSTDISDEKLNAILNTFAKLPQRILWKYEEELPRKLDNVKTSKWFPQDDILAHPNIKLFITHGGLLSSIEALYHGVPILGIPFFADQHNNIAQMKYSGYGQSLLYPDLTEKTFIENIQQILNNSNYSKNIARASTILNDQIDSPLERAIFWTEHVMKYGSSHLRPASLDLNMTEYLLLDIVAFLILIMLLFILGNYFVIKVFWRKCSKICNIVINKHHKRE